MAEHQSSAASPPLPPRPRTRPSTSPSAPPSGHWPSDTGFPVHLPGPPPTAPPADQVMNASYDPRTYGAMPGSLPISTDPATTHTAGPSVQSDTSRWGVRYNQDPAYDLLQRPKPPLPVGTSFIFREASWALPTDMQLPF